MHIGRYLVLHLAPIYLCIIYYFSSRSFLHGSKCRKQWIYKDIVKSYSLLYESIILCWQNNIINKISCLEEMSCKKQFTTYTKSIGAPPNWHPLIFIPSPISSTFFRELGCFLNRIVEYLLNEKTLHACFMFFTVSCQASREMTREYNPQPKYI